MRPSDIIAGSFEFDEPTEARLERRNRLRRLTSPRFGWT
jgi:hypothetical protein